MSKNVLSILGMAAANYGKDSTEAQAELWLEAFSDVDPDLLKKAVMRHVKVSKWFPTVAELLALIDTIKDESDTEGNADHKRFAYWEAMSAYGARLRGEATTLNMGAARIIAQAVMGVDDALDAGPLFDTVPF